MINDLNRVVLIGHVGGDATQSSDTAPVRLSLATTSRWKVEDTQNSRTEWHSLVVFGNLRKYAAKLKKGDRVYVEAEARTSSYDKTVGDETFAIRSTEFHVSQIERVATKSDND